MHQSVSILNIQEEHDGYPDLLLQEFAGFAIDTAGFCFDTAPNGLGIDFLGAGSWMGGGKGEGGGGT